MTLASFGRLGAVVLGVCLALAVPSWAAGVRYGHPEAIPGETGSPLAISIAGGRASAPIVVATGKSQLVRFDRSFRQIVVGSKDVAEIVPMSHNTIYVLGKKRGATNITVTDGGHSVVAVVDVVVSYDIDGLKHQLADLLPKENIDITPAGDALVLSGHVTSSDHLHTILAVADRYAPDAVTNLLQVGGSQQVMLEVKFSEVERSALQNLGVSVLNGNAVNKGIIVPNPVLPSAVTEFGTFGGLLTDLSKYDLRAKLEAMEKKGLVRTLAEPNLVALSGDTANFLAGGEFPIPVVQSSNGTVPTTTIEFKDFGVGLSFTPTVISSDEVNLAMKSEVSALDPSASVTTNGIQVPGLKVRRTATTVELRDGQTFAIAGLIQDDFQDSIDKIPGLGDLPILGALFRSVDYQHNQSELVVFITVHLVQPVNRTAISLPTDRVAPASMLDSDLTGTTGREVPPSENPAAAPPSAAPGAAKPEGYVLP